MKKNPKKDDEINEEQLQGKRLLIANTVLLVMCLASAMIAVTLTALWIFLRWGTEGLIASWDDPYLFREYPYLVYSTALLGIMLIWAAYFLWKRLFYQSGYITPHTQEQFAKGIWPVVGGYWKPVGYVIYIGALSYGAYLGYVQEGLWALLLTLAFVFWLVYRAWIDLRNHARKRHNGHS